MLREHRFTEDVDDIRGATLYGVDHDKLGKIDDVIFDHDTGNIRYAVVDTGGWLKSKKFLVPADRIRPDTEDEDDFYMDATKERIEALPRYDEEASTKDTDWNDYDARYREAWESGPVMHKVGSTHILTPEPDELPAGSGSGAGDAAFSPDRIAGKFPPASQDPNKLRMRPSGLAAKAEDSRLPGAFEPQKNSTLATEEAQDRALQGQRDHLTDADDVYVSESARHARWRTFEDHLRRNRVDITSSCRSCGTAKDKVA
jgi:hypothetical protein